MNNATVTALWSDALNTKTHCEVSGPPGPPLSCKLGVHDVFDRRNYVACRFLFDKCSAGDVCRWFFRVAFNRSKSNFWSLLSTVRQRQKKRELSDKHRSVEISCLCHAERERFPPRSFQVEFWGFVSPRCWKGRRSLEFVRYQCRNLGY